MEQWFNPQTAGTIGGFLGGGLAVAGGIMACSYGIAVRKRWKKLFYAVSAAITALYVGIFITGLIALFTKQPRHVLSPFLISGLIGTMFLAVIFVLLDREFTKHELKQMQAKDL